MAVTLIFMVPFKAELSWPAAKRLANSLNLTLTRTDDWDTQVGFRLVGGTGAIRVYRRVTDEPDSSSRYEVYGTATEWRDRDPVAGLYEACVQAIQSIPGHIDLERVIDPKHAIELKS